MAGDIPAASRVRLHVLLVDDVEDARDMYALYFKHLGVKVETASDGFAALQAIATRRPDIVVLDLAMPRTTGWDVIRELKRNPGTRMLPIVVVSGQRAHDSAIEAGADSYLEKPCVPDTLFTELMRVLYGSRGH
jgi:two-component system, OmpR family, phosphate regulon response regulator PhoB